MTAAETNNGKITKNFFAAVGGVGQRVGIGCITACNVKVHDIDNFSLQSNFQSSIGRIFSDTGFGKEHTTVGNQIRVCVFAQGTNGIVYNAIQCFLRNGKADGTDNLAAVVCNRGNIHDKVYAVLIYEQVSPGGISLQCSIYR